MALTWSPEPQTGRTITASVDRSVQTEYKIVDKESMCSGVTGKSGHASLILSKGKDRHRLLPKRSLAVRDLFRNETVEFPFSDLDSKVHAQLSECF